MKHQLIGAKRAADQADIFGFTAINDVDLVR